MARPARTRKPAVATSDRALFLNRELSWIDFNHRVLQLAADPAIPLLERLKYVAIYANNLDEFFMVRVAGVIDHAENGTTPSDGSPPEATLRGISDRVRALETELEEILHATLLPALAAQDVRILTLAECTAQERKQLTGMFESEIFPVLTPLAVGPGRPFPYISNLSLSLGVFVVDPVSDERRFARVKVPEVLPRFVALERGRRYVALEDVIADNLASLFPGMQFSEHSTFRVTRDADYDISEAAEDLLEAVEQELSRRRFGDVVRLEVEAGMSDEMRDTIVAALDVHAENVYRGRRPIDLADLFPIASIDRPELHDRPWTPQTQPRLRGGDAAPVDIFAEIRSGDILVHHPYDAFSTSVERFIEQAVDDPDVLAIKHTIYRTSGDSPIAPALVRAAEQGKQAVAMVEVTARFDEERNIRWARSLERSGVHVVYGLTGLKTHCKLAMVVRREAGRARRYVHIGTGNYHPATARLYTDLGLFTCREEITADVADVFNTITGFGRPRAYRKLWVAPIEMRQRLLNEIWRCINEHDPDQPARMVLKTNALVDREVIGELYSASQAGVQIDLIVRGICCLRPGVPGLSDTIRVVSILGRFLEHARIYSFRTARGETTFIGSADLMPRNLDNRIEVITPVEDPALVSEVDAILDMMLADTAGCWQLSGDGSWTRRAPTAGQEPYSSQRALMERALVVADSDALGDRREAIAERRLVRRAQPGKPGSPQAPES
jgi:polyphosphate kinase